MIRVSELIKNLADKGAVIFLVSHDFEFITYTCTKMLDLDADEKGRMMKASDSNLQKLAEKYFH